MDLIGKIKKNKVYIPVLLAAAALILLIISKSSGGERSEQVNLTSAMLSEELEGKIELLDCWTPLTYNRYCNAYHGSYMGFVTTVGNKQMSFKGVIKGVDNLFVAGQWVMSPGGLPIALVSGKFAVQRILKRQKRDINI